MAEKKNICKGTKLHGLLSEQIKEEEVEKGPRTSQPKEVSADYKAESEDLKLDWKIRGLVITKEKGRKIKRGDNLKWKS